MNKFEHDIIEVKRDNDCLFENNELLKRKLEEFGNEGWELVQVNSNASNWILFLKREREE